MPIEIRLVSSFQGLNSPALEVWESMFAPACAYTPKISLYGGVSVDLTALLVVHIGRRSASTYVLSPDSCTFVERQ